MPKLGEWLKRFQSEKGVATAQPNEADSTNKLILRKVYTDLKQGLGLSLGSWIQIGSSDSIYAVTRLGDDLFLVSAHNDTTPHDYFPLLDLEKTQIRVGRYKHATLFPGKNLPQGAKEAWRVTPSRKETEGHYVISRYGELEEAEFWRRYNASILDQEATREYAENVKDMYENEIPQYHGLPVRIVSLTESQGKLPEGIIIIDPTPEK